jgi:hypothetical protein
MGLMQESGHQRATLVKITHHNSMDLSALAPAPYTHILRFSGDSNRGKLNKSFKKTKYTLSKWKQHTLGIVNRENHRLNKQGMTDLQTCVRNSDPVFLHQDLLEGIIRVCRSRETERGGEKKGDSLAYLTTKTMRTRASRRPMQA